jgi:membrane-bound ClpP family serine protease
MLQEASQYLAVGSTAGLSKWIQDNIIPLVILILGVLIMVMARRKDHSGALTTVGILLIGLCVVGLALNGAGIAVGQWAASLVFG